MQHGRGVALADFNRDGKTDIVYGNWNGPHRLYMQLNNRKHKFKVGPNVFPECLTTLNANRYTKTFCINVGFKTSVCSSTLEYKVKRQNERGYDCTCKK